MTRRWWLAADWHARTSLKLLFTKWVASRYARFRCPRKVEQPGNEMRLASVVGNNAEVRTAAATAARSVSTRGHRKSPRRRWRRALAILFYFVYLHNYTCSRRRTRGSPRSEAAPKRYQSCCRKAIAIVLELGSCSSASAIQGKQAKQLSEESFGRFQWWA